MDPLRTTNSMPMRTNTIRNPEPNSLYHPPHHPPMSEMYSYLRASFDRCIHGTRLCLQYISHSLYKKFPQDRTLLSEFNDLICSPNMRALGILQPHCIHMDTALSPTVKTIIQHVIEHHGVCTKLNVALIKNLTQLLFLSIPDTRSYKYNHTIDICSVDTCFVFVHYTPTDHHSIYHDSYASIDAKTQYEEHITFSHHDKTTNKLDTNHRLKLIIKFVKSHSTMSLYESPGKIRCHNIRVDKHLDDIKSNSRYLVLEFKHEVQ